MKQNEVSMLMGFASVAALGIFFPMFYYARWPNPFDWDAVILLGFPAFVCAIASFSLARKLNAKLCSGIALVVVSLFLMWTIASASRMG